MTPSLPCPKCGHVDDLETVTPLWMLMDEAVLWKCRCGITREILISHHPPQELIRKAKEVNELRDWIDSRLGYKKTG